MDWARYRGLQPGLSWNAPLGLTATGWAQRPTPGPPGTQPVPAVAESVLGRRRVRISGTAFTHEIPRRTPQTSEARYFPTNP
jgi:hypothetical protein